MPLRVPSGPAGVRVAAERAPERGGRMGTGLGGGIG